MKLGSLFAGVGGLDLGLEAAGFGPVAWQVEIDPFCQKVLAKHWPQAQRHEDVRLVGSDSLEPVDLICGGFPCQDVSAAGKRKGLEGERSGLWYEYRRILGELRPRIAVVENVASGARSWLPTVRRQLCELGYATTALAISAEDVGAPHRRARIFVVALADTHGVRERQPGRCLSDIGGWSGDGCQGKSVADASGERRTQRRPEPARDEGGLGAAIGSLSELGNASSAGWLKGGGLAEREGQAAIGTSGWHPEPGMGRDVAGLSRGLDRHKWPAGRGEPQHEWEPPRTAQARTVKNRVARVKALGNAVVPQCAYVVGLWIREQLSLTPR